MNKLLLLVQRSINYITVELIISKVLYNSYLNQSIVSDIDFFYEYGLSKVGQSRSVNSIALTAYVVDNLH